MNTIHKFFPIATLICAALPLVFHQDLGNMTFFLSLIFALLMPIFAVKIADKTPENNDKSRFTPIFLLGLPAPFMDLFTEIDLWNVFLLVLFWVIFSSIMSQNIHATIKWYIALLLPVFVGACWVFHLEVNQLKQSIHQNQALLIHSKIPDKRLEIKQPRRIDYAFSVNGIRFECKDDERKRTAMDTLLCRDIYQYAGQPVTMYYILENHLFTDKQKPRMVSLHVNGKQMWSPEHTLAHYVAREQQVWREFRYGLLLISLPFLLLYCWARKIVFQAA